MKVQLENLVLKYGKFTALHDFNLQIEDGESIVLLGQSGCGKTSAMRCVAGLERPTSGKITVGGAVVFDGGTGVNVPPNKRNIGMVFQSYAIWPHMTVFDNVAYSLATRKQSRAEIQKRVMAALKTVGLQAFAERGASLLSGGQMQRVALARSLVMEPGVLLLDEPLSNLDARLRDRLRVELREIQLRLGLTCIYVTHDQSEAFALADRIAIMQDGRIVQIDTPQSIYSSPITSRIADFLGVSNIFPCSVAQLDAGHYAARLADHDLTVHASAAPRVPLSGGASLCVRPECLRIAPDGGNGPTQASQINSWPGKIIVASFQGDSVRYAVQLDNGPEVDVAQLTREGPVLNANARVRLSLDPCEAQILPVEVPA